MTIFMGDISFNQDPIDFKFRFPYISNSLKILIFEMLRCCRVGSGYMMRPEPDPKFFFVLGTRPDPTSRHPAPGPTRRVCTRTYVRVRQGTGYPTGLQDSNSPMEEAVDFLFLTSFFINFLNLARFS